MTINRLVAASAMMAAATQVHAAAPLLRFSFAKDPDYTVVTARGLRGEHVATIEEVTFHPPVIYPAPDYDNAVIAAADYPSRDFGDYDTVVYMRLRRTVGQRWDVFECVVTGLYRVPDRDGLDVDKVARSALVRALKARRPIPGERCKPAEEIQKGSRIY